jgi:hypothetical protein
MTSQAVVVLRGPIDIHSHIQHLAEGQAPKIIEMLV